MRLHARAWLAAAVIVVILLTALEVAARCFSAERSESRPAVELRSPGGPDSVVAADDTDLGWSLTPGALLSTSGERANSLGLRGPEPASKPAQRILCLGTSNTFGLGVPREDAYPAHLQRWAGRAAGEPWEVWNAGVPRYSVIQMLAWFRRRGRAAAPRIVVVLPRGWDHVTPACVKSDEECLGVLSGRGSAVKTASFLELRFPRWLGLAPAPALPPVVRPSTSELLQGWRTRRQRPNGPRVSPAEFKKALRVLRDEILASGARLVFVNSPSRAVLIQGYPELSDYVGVLESVAGERGVPLVHAREEFNLEAERDEKHFLDDHNLTADAHARLAQSVSWCLANLGVPSLPKAATPGEPTKQVELRPLLGKASLTHPESKTPLDLTPFLDAGMKDLATPSPSVLTLERLTLGASTLLRLHLSLIEPVPTETSPKGAPPRLVRVAVYVLTPAGERRRVFVEDSNRSDWSRLLDLGARTIDLSEFAGEAVQLELEVLGDSLYVDWGRPALVSYEPGRG